MKIGYLQNLTASELKELQREVKSEINRRVNVAVENKIKDLYVGAICTIDERVLKKSDLMNYQKSLFKVVKINKKNVKIEEVENPQNMWTVIASTLNIVE
jgi:DNA-binding transcriptional regulator WhiA